MEEVSSPDKEMVRVTFSSFQMIGVPVSERPKVIQFFFTHSLASLFLFVLFCL